MPDDPGPSQPRFLDPKSVAGKAPVVSETIDLLVVGAGKAGLRAAIEAASAGIQTVLVDENPVSHETMGEEVPRHFGQAMSGATRNRNAMIEAFVASEPLFEAAFEAGVDIRLGTACWGLYAKGPALRHLPGLVAGLVDATAAMLVAPRRVIVATGRRDMGLGFPGWHLPGVMGASAARLLVERHAGALDAKRVVVLGSDTEALLTALAFAGQGITVAAIIEQAERPVAPADLVAVVKQAGIPILCRSVVREALGRERVEGAMIGTLDTEGIPTGAETRLGCDGIVLAVGAVPMIDLLQAAGAACRFDPDRGGHVPVIDANGRTSLPDVFAIGDCAGIWPGKSRDPAIAEAEARRAVDAMMGRDSATPALAPPRAEINVSTYRKAWLRASVIHARAEFPLCQCEEVTARDLLELRPPRYVGWEGQMPEAHSLAALLAAGPPDPDQLKRMTRAGMGPCQGRRCREQIAALLALEADADLSAVPLASYRAPVRPLPLALAGLIGEAPLQTEHWDSWFGMHAQWRPFWEVQEHFTLAGNDTSGEVASE